MPIALKFALVALVATAAVYDFRFRRIPNWLNLSGLVLGLGLNTFLFAGHGLAAASLGTLLPLAIYIPLYLLRAMGAGDVKLMAAVGSIAGPKNWIEILVCTALAGGIIAVALAASRRHLQRTLTNTVVLATELSYLRPPATTNETLDVRNNRSMKLPHGVTIAIGSLTFITLARAIHA